MTYSPNLRARVGGKACRGATAGLLASAALGFLAQAADAQAVFAVPAPSQGYYIGGGLGANLQESNRFRGGKADATVGYGTGFAGIMDFGYGLGNGLRLELEPGYRWNSVNRINGSSASGRTQMATLMGNLLYDFNYVTPIIPLQPYLGVGVGYAHVWDRSGPQNGVGVSGQANVPAFQGIAGLDYALSPTQKIGIDYHYLVAHDAAFHVNNGLATHAGDLDNHTFLVSYRFQFGAPQAPAVQPAAYVAPPMPASVAAPAPQRPFEVYFDFDSARLTPEGRAVVDQAAANAKTGNATVIKAAGHTDTVGSAPYNQVLSMKRANSVRTALVGDGISAGEIETAALGKTDLAVPTADDVNEPRNRRVEILIETPGM